MVEVKPGPPAEPSDMVAAEEIQKMQGSELDDVRQQADKWRNGLAGIVGFSTVATGLKAAGIPRDQLETGQTVAAALLLGSVVLGGLGGFWAMRAAYSFPTRRLAESTFRELVVRRRLRLRRACVDLRRAVIATYVSLGIVVAALALAIFS